jgi:cytochrome c oxidase assembly protein subunit 15
MRTGSSLPPVPYRPALALFALAGSAWVFVLVMLGAFTTTIGAGMAFADWPLSNGSLNPRGWLTDAAMFAEHSHRLSGTVMGLVTLTLAIWLQRSDSRAWLRRLGWSAVVLVIVQGLVGGERVRLDAWHVAGLDMSVGQALRVPHGIIAQIFVLLLYAIAAALSRPWIEAPTGVLALRPGLRKLGIVCVALMLAQLAIAATMRHMHAGMAIPTFPLTPQGDLVPSAWNFAVGIHFAHRVMALVIGAAVALYVGGIWRERRLPLLMKRTAAVAAALLAMQILLGAVVIWTLRNPYYTTAHVIVGACTFGFTFLLTWFGHRDVLERRPGPGADARTVIDAPFRSAHPISIARR